MFGATQGAEPVKTLRFFSRFNAKRYKKGIKLKILYNTADRAFARRYIKSKRLDEIRFLDLQTPAEITIYGSKVAITLLTKTPLAIVITSEEAAASFLQYFEKMWKIAKK